MFESGHSLYERTEPEVVATEEVDQPVQQHALYARNLCPVCPSGAKVSSRSFMERMFGLRTFDYCELTSVGPRLGDD